MYDVVTGSEIATMVRPTLDLSETQMADVKAMLNVIPLNGATPSEHGRMVRIVLDGRWIGSCTDPASVLDKLNDFRRKVHDLNVSFVWSKMELDVRTRSGRLQRPLIYVTDDGVLSCDAGDEPVRYVDSVEVGASYVAPGRSEFGNEHTYVEVHGSLLFGEGSNRTLVFADHMNMSAARTSLRCGSSPTDETKFISTQTKQSIEVALSKETPLVQTGYGCPAQGRNVVVALLCYEGNTVVLNTSINPRKSNLSLTSSELAQPEVVTSSIPNFKYLIFFLKVEFEGICLHLVSTYSFTTFLK
jgi:DNA-directed RNA polymerase beta subunit